MHHFIGGPLKRTYSLIPQVFYVVPGIIDAVEQEKTLSEQQALEEQKEEDSSKEESEENNNE